METTTDAIGKDKCSAALSIIRNILRATEAEVYKNEKTVMALEINEKLEGRCNQVDQLAMFIRSGPVMKVPRRAAGRKYLHRHLFLFSDYLIITDPVSPTGKYVVKSELTVVSMVVEDISSQDDLQIPFGIRVKAIENVVELSFTSDEEKLSWLKTLEDTIEQEQRKRDSFHAATAASVKTSGSPTEKRAAEWVKDEQASMCALCYKTFTVTRRKHHCRACGKIFCDRCSSYRTKVDYLGDSEVRVCEIDFYRLNPHLKPPTAACVDRLTRFSALPPRFAPLQSGYLLWVYRTRSHWTRKKGHLKVEYSTGVLPSTPEQPSDPQIAVHFQNHTTSEQVNLQFSAPQSNRQPSSPFLLNCASQAPFSLASLGDDDFTIPLPAARLTITPQLSRVYAVLQPNSTLCIYAAKEDAKPKHQLPVLGMRLLYLIQLLGPHENEAQAGGMRPSAPPSTTFFTVQHPNLGSLCDSSSILRHTSSVFGDDRASLTSTTSSSSNSTSGEADVHTPGVLFNRLHQHSSDVSTLRNVSTSDSGPNPKYKTTRPPKRLGEAAKSAVTETDSFSALGFSQAPSPTELEISRILCQDTVFQPPTVPSVNGHADRSSSTLQPPCDDVDCAASNTVDNMDTGYVQSHPTPKISDDALAVLTNTRGLLLLPLNNDCIGHYLEAPTETIRNEWIKQIRASVVNLFNQVNASKPDDG
uniref:FYVE, RhoGEF and PH domain-containing protein 6 n=3 Tax=Schistocephalus solidus TaxID=70667 RepID=A0A0V0J635_SCHSO